MPKVHTSRREVLSAIGKVPSLAELTAGQGRHFDYEIDLEVAVYGRRYRGGRVGPYIHLYTYDPGELIIQEGDWGGNTFYIVVDGQVETFVRSGQSETKVAEIGSGGQFGEMSVLAGVPRNATVRAKQNGPAQILEVQRPALRFLRKLPVFAQALDETYRSHGKNSILEALTLTSHFSEQTLGFLREAAQFRILSANDGLVFENSAVQQVYILREGWIRRDKTTGEFDFLGKGYCLGAETLGRSDRWPYSVTALGRTEILRVPIASLDSDSDLTQKVFADLAPLAPPEMKNNIQSNRSALPALEKLIEEGLADGTNLLIMDMDLCVRCGNCSMACQRIHGQSRLLRKGIALRRIKPEGSSAQPLLFPAACLHCKDPKCMTGCPTGAISRLPQGHIDISPQLCIGCGDCASQCPYHAISMVPRNNPAPPGKKPRLFQIRAEPLPPPVEQTEDMVAVKCNLCEGTALNPPGVKRAAYGCEESCPTGALVRVNPHAYFKEVAQIESLLFMDSTHAVGRNLHASDPARQRIHILGIVLLLLVAAGLLQNVLRFGLDPAPGTFLNLRWITGLSGFLLLAAVMTYPVRRRIYRRRAGALRYWTLFHYYLGAMATIVIFTHAGRSSGGILSTALMLCFDLTLLTGIFGLLCYRFVPRLINRLEPEPLLMDDLLARRSELQKEIRSALAQAPEMIREIVKNKILPSLLSIQSLLKQFLRNESVDQLKTRLCESYADRLPVPERESFEKVIAPAVLLVRIESLIQLQRLLKLWVLPHIIFTSLLISLMLVHIIQVFYFSGHS